MSPLNGKALETRLLQHAIHMLRNENKRGRSEKIPALTEEGTRDGDIGTVPCTPLQVDLGQKRRHHRVSERAAPTDLRRAKRISPKPRGLRQLARLPGHPQLKPVFGPLGRIPEIEYRP